MYVRTLFLLKWLVLIAFLISIFIKSLKFTAALLGQKFQLLTICDDQVLTSIAKL